MVVRKRRLEDWKGGENQDTDRDWEDLRCASVDDAGLVLFQIGKRT